MTTTDRLYRPQDNIKTRQPPLTRFMGGFILSLDRLATKDVTVQRPSWTESQAASR
ncbi:MAG: hypothetical protein JF615_06405 [Asticcacaulis sp.]|nr:hypothetical protein [Asticcacaulis sp.]